MRFGGNVKLGKMEGIIMKDCCKKYRDKLYCADCGKAIETTPLRELTNHITVTIAAKKKGQERHIKSYMRIHDMSREEASKELSDNNIAKWESWRDELLRIILKEAREKS